MAVNGSFEVHKSASVHHKSADHCHYKAWNSQNVFFYITVIVFV